MKALGFALRVEAQAVELPWTPAFLHKQDGFVFSMGQFKQWVGAQVMASGLVQIWPGTPVAAGARGGQGGEGGAPPRPGRGPPGSARGRLPCPAWTCGPA